MREKEAQAEVYVVVSSSAGKCHGRTAGEQAARGSFKCGNPTLPSAKAVFVSRHDSPESKAGRDCHEP